MECKGEECKNYWSCKMLQDRFGVKECFPLKKWLIVLKHKEELKKREEMLRGIKRG